MIRPPHTQRTGLRFPRVSHAGAQVQDGYFIQNSTHSASGNSAKHCGSAEATSPQIRPMNCHLSLMHSVSGCVPQSAVWWRWGTWARSLAVHLVPGRNSERAAYGAPTLWPCNSARQRQNLAQSPKQSEQESRKQPVRTDDVPQQKSRTTARYSEAALFPKNAAAHCAGCLCAHICH